MGASLNFISAKRTSELISDADLGRENPGAKFSWYIDTPYLTNKTSHSNHQSGNDPEFTRIEWIHQQSSTPTRLVAGLEQKTCSTVHLTDSPQEEFPVQEIRRIYFNFLYFTTPLLTHL
jgi:hypothetical protein